jgi:hypothetical protein
MGIAAILPAGSYQYITDPISKLNSGCLIRRLTDGAYIPFDPSNVDFQQYQRWLAAGNTPTAAT